MKVWQAIAAASAAWMFVLPTSPAAATTEADLGMEQLGGLQFLSTGSHVLYISADVPEGADTAFEVRIDVSAVDSRVRFMPEPGYLDCDSGSVIICRGAASSSGAKVVALRYTIDSNAAAGRAGRMNYSIAPATPGVTDPNPGNNSRSVEVEVRRPELGSDKEIQTTRATGALGTTVTATMTVTNRGPNTELYFRLHPVFLSDPSAYEVTGGVSPCSGNACEHKMIRPGDSRTFTFRIRLIGCAQPNHDFISWTTETDGTDPNPYNNYARISIQPDSCQTANNSSGGSNTQNGTEIQIVPALSAEPETASSPGTSTAQSPAAAAEIPETASAAAANDGQALWAITVVTVAAAGLIALLLIPPVRKLARPIRRAASNLSATTESES